MVTAPCAAVALALAQLASEAVLLGKAQAPGKFLQLQHCQLLFSCRIAIPQPSIVQLLRGTQWI